MSLPSGNAPAGPHRKPRADLYTVMLLVAFLALIVATVMMYLETQDYGSPPYRGAPSAMAAPMNSLEAPAPWASSLV